MKRQLGWKELKQWLHEQLARPQWIPAFAGMTIFSYKLVIYAVIPAQAGIHAACAGAVNGSRGGSAVPHCAFNDVTRLHQHAA